MRLLKPLKIGTLELKNPVILAPMVDITDLPYRLLCRKAGAALAYTEMINVPAILHKNEKTQCMLKTLKADSPLGVQITGNNIEEFKKVMPFLKKYALVDLNCGCPADRIIRNDSGSYLLTKPKKIFEIIKFLKSEGFIVTAKIRLGFKKNNVLEVAKIIEKAGADAITIHARLANQGYDIKADWSWIAKVKKAVKIPVIGNGDIFTGKDAEKMLMIADGVMIARAAIGDPLVFKRILHYLKTGKELQFNFKENIKCFKEYLILAKEYNLINIVQIKRLGCHFIKNINGAAKLRNQLMQLQSLDEIKIFFDEIVLKK